MKAGGGFSMIASLEEERRCRKLCGGLKKGNFNSG
jgi:hypothetical protein